MASDWTDLHEIDRVIHEPARLIVLGILAVAGECDFMFLMNETALTKGNLSSHLMKLEDAGFVAIEKTFKGKVPLTIVRETPAGKIALNRYRKTMLEVLR